MKRVCVSFDYENDARYKRLLNAWHENNRFDFEFDDKTPNEIDSSDIGRIKAGLTLKIKDAQVLLVIIGEHANSMHKDHNAIGEKNWINWEIAKAKELGKKIVAVKTDKSNTSPDNILSCNANWVYSFNEKDIIDALR